MQAERTTLGPFEQTAASSNITYYRARGSGVWVSVLHSGIVKDGDKWRRKTVDDYYLTIYRDGEGEIGRLSYTPARGKGQLAPRTVARLVREWAS